MVVFPNAKINIGLQILNKREDGYHNLESIFYPVGLCDVLEIVKADVFSFNQSGISIAGNESDNLVVKAYNLMKTEYGIGNVAIHLHKVIPMGAGLGGGSSDATFTLKVLNELFQLSLSEITLQLLAEKLGSDCPFFVSNKPSLVKGRGEIINETSINLTKYWIKIVHLGIHISTKEAFSGIKPNIYPVNYKSILYTETKFNFNRFINDFELTICKNHPNLLKLKNQLLKEGAIYASMTGSGSAFFGIYETEPTKTETENFEYIGRLEY